MTQQEGKWYQVQLKYLSPKILKNVITEKIEKLCQTTGIPGTQGAFPDKVTTDIDVFNDEPVIQCDVKVEANTFLDGSI